MIMSGKLNSKIWSHTTRREDGVIFIGGKAVTDLAEKYETPSFILDEEDFKLRAQKWRTSLEAHFGAKAGTIGCAMLAFDLVKAGN